jgi:hypothetical protein
MTPKSRVDRLVVEEAGDELLVYDLDHDEAHCLSAIAAAVWRNCDGEQDVAALAEHLPDSARGQAEIVVQALDELRDKRLLVDNDDSPLRITKRWSRRQFVVRAGAASAALSAPLVVSVSAAQAVTLCGTCGTGAGCTSGGNCGSGLTCCASTTTPVNNACKCVATSKGCAVSQC